MQVAEKKPTHSYSHFLSLLLLCVCTHVHVCLCVNNLHAYRLTSVWQLHTFMINVAECPVQEKDGENKRKSMRRGESVAGVNTDITVLIKPSYLVAVRWPTGMTLCVSVLKWSVHHLLCVHGCICLCVCMLYLSLCQQFVCVCMCVLKFVLGSAGYRAREKEKCYRFLAQPCERKICLGGTVITSLSHPSLTPSLSPYPFT